MAERDDTASGRLIVMSTGAYQAALDEIAGHFRQQSGFAVEPAYASAAAIAARISAGEVFDVAITTESGMAALVASGLVLDSSRHPAGANAVCLAYRSGAAPPRAATPEALRDTLLQASSISLSDPVHGGGSSKYFIGILASLGLEAAITPKLVFTPGGQGAAPVASGAAELGIAQTSEIAALPGLAAAPLLPGAPESRAAYEIAMATRAPSPRAAAALIDYFSGPAGASIRAKCGLAG